MRDLPALLTRPARSMCLTLGATDVARKAPGGTGPRGVCCNSAAPELAVGTDEPCGGNGGAVTAVCVRDCQREVGRRGVEANRPILAADLVLFTQAVSWARAHAACGRSGKRLAGQRPPELLADASEPPTAVVDELPASSLVIAHVDLIAAPTLGRTRPAKQGLATDAWRRVGPLMGVPADARQRVVGGIARHTPMAGNLDDLAAEVVAAQRGLQVLAAKELAGLADGPLAGCELEFAVQAVVAWAVAVPLSAGAADSAHRRLALDAFPDPRDARFRFSRAFANLAKSLKTVGGVGGRGVAGGGEAGCQEEQVAAAS